MNLFRLMTFKVLTLSEVELNQNYAIVISTNAGLWRYKIGDTVCFTSLDPFRIRITGRTAHFINAFGEELIVENAERAISETCIKSGAVIREYTASPIYFSDESCGAHEWLIEFEKHPESLELFADILDQELKNVNSDYEAKRYKSMALRPPIIKSLPENTFFMWLKSKEKLGGQHKVPRLSNDRKIVEDVLNFAAKISV